MRLIIGKPTIVNGKAVPERRDSARKRVLKGATISFNNGYGAFECVVRNVSDSGAFISMGESIGLPSRFDIAIADEPPRAAKIRWQTMSSLGVSLD